MIKFFKDAALIRRKMIAVPAGLEAIEEAQADTTAKIEEAERLLLNGEKKWFADKLEKADIICACQLNERMPG